MVRGLGVVAILAFAVACGSGSSAKDAAGSGGGGAAGQDAGADAAGGATAGGATAGTFVDPRDGHPYTELTIGAATWMGENLAWEAPSGSFCYENDPASCTTGGRLYNHDVAQSACPSGWHLSTDDEWKALETHLGMPAVDLDVDAYATVRGSDQGTRLKAGGDSGLDFPMTGYASTSGGTATAFDGLTTGVVRSYIWTATAGGKGVYRRRLEQSDAHVYRFSNPPTGFAIVARCVKG